MLLCDNRMERDDFGPELRRERERRGISLEELSVATKVSVELWEGMERNDFSRWPSGIFARAFVRDYARVIGLDTDAVVNEFCRHFPNGDRRASRIVKGQAALIGHALDVNERELLPAGRERRRPQRSAAPAMYEVYLPRVATAIVDAACVLTVALFASSLIGGRWSVWLGVCALIYYPGAMIALGTTPGQRAVHALRLRAPSLFSSRRPVNA